jgi:hypothetical protein
MKRSNYTFFSLLLIVLGLLASGCEEEFIPPIESEPPQIVVEGYIESGQLPTPPYVILTRSIPFSTSISSEELDDIFVRDAIVKVSSEEQTITLEEFCLNELPDEIRNQLIRLMGYDETTFSLNVCLYTDLSFQFLGEEGKHYELEIYADGEVLTSSTFIPPHVPLDTLFFLPPPGDIDSSFAQMRCIISDPADLDSYYRYFTQVNREPFYAGLPSVSDDRLFNGLSFEFPLFKGEPFGEVVDETYGLFDQGDTITIKWCTMDESHYRFWNTLEFNTANQGPFSSYTRIESNINGGLGVWGGYSNSYYPTVVGY